MADEKQQPIIIIKKKGGGGHGHHGGAWKVAYADFVTAMMAFFLVMWLMGSDEEVKSSISDYFNQPTSAANLFPSLFDGGDLNRSAIPKEIPYRKPDSVIPQGPSTKEKMDPALQRKIANFVELKNEIQNFLEAKGMGKDVDVIWSEQGTIIRVKNKIMFRAGSAKLMPDIQAFLDKVLQIMKQTEYFMEIGGHTDSSPMKSEQYPSNWELSGARATTTLRYFMAYGMNVDRMKAIAYGDSQPISIIKDGISTVDLDQSRRVEFLLRDRYDIEKPEARVPASPF